MLNIVSIMGRLTADPRYNKTNGGVSVASFTLACERDFGEKATDFFDVIAWRGTAEFADKYLHKGQRVAILGRLQLRKWTDDDGKERRVVEIVAESIYFADKPRE